MSIKHVKEEYKRLNDTFDEMIETLHEAEDMASQNIVGPDFVNNIKIMVEPMKINKARWDQMIYLLNLPNKPEKEKRYKVRNEKLVQQLDKIKQEEQQENEECIANLRREISKNVTDNV